VDLDDELAADGLELTPERDELDSPAPLDPDQVEARSTLAQHLRPSAFPGGVADLIAAAEAEDAPASVVALLQELPPATYHTVNEVWVALGGASEARPDLQPPEEAEPSEPPPSEPALAEPTAPPATDEQAQSWPEQLAHVVGATATTAVRVVVGIPVAIVSHIGRLLRRH